MLAAALPPTAPFAARRQRLRKQTDATRSQLGGVLGCGALGLILLVNSVHRSPSRELGLPSDFMRPSYATTHAEDMKALAKANEWVRPSETDSPAASAATGDMCPWQDSTRLHVDQLPQRPFQAELTGSKASSSGGNQPAPERGASDGSGGAVSIQHGMVTCSLCETLHPYQFYSKSQSKKPLSLRKCENCLKGSGTAPAMSEMSEEDRAKREIMLEDKVQKICSAMSCGVPTGILYGKEEGNPFSNRLRAPFPPSDDDRASGKAGLEDYKARHDLDKAHASWVQQCRLLLKDGGQPMNGYSQEAALQKLEQSEANLAALPKHISHAVCMCGIDHRAHAIKGKFFISTLGLRPAGVANVCPVKSKFAESLNGNANAADILGLADAIEAGHLPQPPTAMCKTSNPKVGICTLPADKVLLPGTDGFWVADENDAVCVLLAKEKVPKDGLEMLENSLYQGAVAGGSKLLTRGDSVAAIGTNFLKWGLKEERTIGLLMCHSLPTTRPLEQRAAGTSTSGSVKMASSDRLFLMEKQQEMMAFYKKYVHPIVESYLFAEFASVGIYMDRQQMALFVRQVTAATTGELFWALTHTDDDVFFSVLVKHATAIHASDKKAFPDACVQQSDQGGDFALPDRGIVVPLERGNVLVYNPRKLHAATEHGTLRFPTSRGCMTAFYVKASCIRAWFTSNSYVHRVGMPTLVAAHARAMQEEFPNLRAPGVPGKRKLEEDDANKGRDASSGKSLRDPKKTRPYEA